MVTFFRSPMSLYNSCLPVPAFPIHIRSISTMAHQFVFDEFISFQLLLRASCWRKGPTYYQVISEPYGAHEGHRGTLVGPPWQCKNTPCRGFIFNPNFKTKFKSSHQRTPNRYFIYSNTLVRNQGLAVKGKQARAVKAIELLRPPCCRPPSNGYEKLPFTPPHHKSAGVGNFWGVKYPGN